MPAPVTAIVVFYEGLDELRRSLASLESQASPPAEILVVDNHPDALAAGAVKEWGGAARVLSPGRNLGFGRACNMATAEAANPWLFFLNPDAVAAPDCIERLLEAAGERTAIVGAQVLLPDGDTVNAGDNPVHISGLSWSGRYLEPRENGAPREAASVSGAGYLVRTAAYRELGGHCPAFFLYVEDTDISWRARMAGWQVMFAPRAAVVHAYEFQKGSRKWLYLEHNRQWMVLSNYAPRTLLLLAPLLLAAEVGIALQARRDGWLPEKRRAWRSTVREWSQLSRWRRHVQHGRRVGDRELMARMSGTIETPLLNSPLLVRVNPWMERYRRAVLRALRA
jgi:GT2 family glycosyltransferase